MNRSFPKLRDQRDRFTNLLKSKMSEEKSRALLSAAITIGSAFFISLIGSTLPDFPFLGFFCVGFLSWPFLLIWFTFSNRVNFLIFLSGVIGANLVIVFFGRFVNEIFDPLLVTHTAGDYLKDLILGQLVVAPLVWIFILGAYWCSLRLLRSLPTRS